MSARTVLLRGMSIVALVAAGGWLYAFIFSEASQTYGTIPTEKVSQYSYMQSPTDQSLKARFNYLPDSKFLVVTELIKNRESSSKFSPFTGAAETAAGSNPLVNIHAEIEQLLDDDELHEFQLRESYIAGRLRSLDIPLSNDQYKYIYRLLNGDNHGGNLGEFHYGHLLAAYDPALFDQQEYNLLIKHLDPNYQMLKAVMTHYHIGDEKLEQAYQWIRDTYFTDSRFISAGSTGQYSTQNSASGGDEFLQQNLMSSLGEEAAQAIIRNIRKH